MNVAGKEPVYIIIPVHNRKQITLKCLENLKQCGDLQCYHTIVVDDGSRDGTTQAINSLYPDVIILAGDGNLWWTGAIKKGMEYAYQQGAEYFIWLNDDTLPGKNSIDSIVFECKKKPQTIVTGQCYSTDSLAIPTYGGQRKEKLSLKSLFAKVDEVIDCDCTNGNLVAFPRSVVEKIGFPKSDFFPQVYADVMYTWTAKEQGFNLKVCGYATAICSFNPLESNWSTSSISMKERWRIINTPKSNLYPPSFWNYCKIFYKKYALLIFTQAYLKLIIFTLLRAFIPIKIMISLKITLLRFFS